MISAAARLERSASLLTPPLARISTASSTHLLGLVVADPSSDCLGMGNLASGGVADFLGELGEEVGLLEQLLAV
jgi:hypothetical protein